MRTATFSLRAEVQAPSRACRAAQKLSIEPLATIPQPPPKPFAEEGAINSHHEYKWWLHVRLNTTDKASMVYPWPFARAKLDAPLLISYWHVTRYAGWPGAWNNFAADLMYCHKNLMHEQQEVCWCLQPTPVDRGTWQFDPIPKEMFDAFT